MTHQESFELLIRKLEIFKAVYGHCMVPQKFDDLWLGRKVQTTRIKYKKGLMTDDQIEALNKLGFIWKAYNNPQEAWDLFIEKLIVFKKEHRHCNVPANYPDKWFANYTTRIRSRYKDNIVDTKRIKKLEKLGFKWKLSTHPKNNLR
ncbi:MAG: helicase associated domain-containing protein [Salinivirgaceae bacterium]|nr:helicase associated domain-containing protein [Salinivirgaceae bacterium]